MVTCSACSKTSTLDSRFCRSCGSPLDSEAIAAAETELGALLSAGKEMLEEGRAEEAVLTAKEALAHHPGCYEAYALLGDAQERLGELALALDAYEHVAELHPDSPLDRIKLTHLRNQLQGKSLAAPPPRKGAALGAGLAAMVLVGCVGAALALRGQSVPVTDSQPNQPVVQQATPTAAGAMTQGAGTATPVDRGSETASQPEPQRTEASAPVATRTSADGTLPAAARSGPPTVEPMPIGPIKIVPNDRPADTNPKVESRDPDPGPVTSTKTDGSKPAEVKRPPGIIEITPSKDSGSRPVGGSESLGGDAANLVRVARQRYATGDYAGSADAYEKALSAGGDAGSINQRLAQCYEKLGRKSDAKECYRRAIAAYERRNDDSSRAALAACRTALQVLGG